MTPGWPPCRAARRWRRTAGKATSCATPPSGAGGRSARAAGRVGGIRGPLRRPRLPLFVVNPELRRRIEHERIAALDGPAVLAVQRDAPLLDLNRIRSTRDLDIVVDHLDTLPTAATDLIVDPVNTPF